MILAVFLFQAAVVTPKTAPTAQPTPPAQRDASAPRTLADVARERKLNKETNAGSFSAAGSTAPRAVADPGKPASSRARGETPNAAAKEGEVYWRGRAAAARAELAAANDEANEIPPPTIDRHGNVYDPYQLQRNRAVMRQGRAQEAIANLAEEGRKAGAAPGWLR
jgi:hypothetical protein